MEKPTCLAEVFDIDVSTRLHDVIEQLSWQSRETGHDGQAQLLGKQYGREDIGLSGLQAHELRGVA